MNTALYHISHLRHGYGGRIVLDIRDLTVMPGTITGIMGPNGSGKSTLLKLMAFIDSPRHGHIHFKGRPETPFSERVRFKITLLTQEPYLMKRSVYQNVLYGLKLRNVYHDVDQRIDETFRWVGLSSDRFLHRKWYALSGGETQRVALAARLVLQPEVLLMDEPTANVDGESRQLIQKAALRARHEWGTTLIIAGHDQEWLTGIADRVLYLNEGRLNRFGRDNVVGGPFEKKDDGFYEKVLLNGQRIRVCPSGTPGRSVILPVSAVRIGIDGGFGGGSVSSLEGTISRLLLDKETNDIIASVDVGDYLMSMRVTGDSVLAKGLFPGKQVQVSFDPTHTFWA